MSTDTPSPAAPKAPPPQENALLNILLNVLLPVVVLGMCSKDDKWYSLGPKWSLVVASLLPLGYFLWDYRVRRKINSMSIIGIASVLFTGGLGLLELSAQAFAWKEASVPLIIAGVIWWTSRGEKPLVRAMLLSPDVFDVDKMERAVDAHNVRPEFDRLLRSSTWLIIASMLLSAVLNYVLAIYFLTGKEPGTAAYSEAIGRQHGWGWLVIGVPSMAMMGFAMIRMFKGLKRLTGLETEELMHPR